MQLDPGTATTVFRCPGCGARSAPHGPSRCGCGELLEVERPVLEDLRATFRARRAPRPDASGVWRFAEWVDGDLAGSERVSLGEGDTPLLSCPELAREVGHAGRLWIQHEGWNPTGSFKDRGMTVAVSRARAAGARRLACASTGNTAASLAAYAARAGLEAVVFVPEGATALGKLSQAAACGARVLQLEGDFDAAMRVVQELAEDGELHLVNSLNPWRLEGQRTILFQLLEALEWRAPDWIVVPAGNLGNTAALGKGLRELRAAGLLERVPRLCAVQAAGASPFVAAFERGFDRLEPVEARTRATAIRIGDPVSYARAVRALRETDGVALAVDDERILEAKRAIDRAGIGGEPASCSTLAGVRELRTRGLLGPDQDVALVLTGHLLKDPQANLEGAAVPERVPARARSIAERLRNPPGSTN